MAYGTETCNRTRSASDYVQGSVVLCSALVAFGVVVALSHFNQGAASSSFSISSTRAVSPKLLSVTSAPHVNSLLRSYNRAVEAAEPIAQEDAVQLQVPKASSGAFLSLSALVGALFGIATAVFFQKGSEKVQAEDDEAPPRANWAVGLAAAATLALPQTIAPPDMMPQAMAGLPNSELVNNPEALLRYALPIDNKEIREIQKELESISKQLRIPGSKPIGPISKIVSNAQNKLKNDRNRQNIIAAFAPDKKEAGLRALDDLKRDLELFQEGLKGDDKQLIPVLQEKALTSVGAVEAAMVKGFPFEVPAKYASLPQLRGRATVECKLIFKDNLDINEGILTIVLDGFSAPVTAGNFYDLVEKDFYNGMKIQRADGFVVQTGDPDGAPDGYINPKTGDVRNIPFEVMVKGDKDPYYETPLEDLGIYNAPVTLPFNAFGTMAMARREFVPNSSSSQFFWLLKDSELTPVGNNVLDGRYSVFGYITKNSDLLKEVKVGDEIAYMKVIDGQENFVPGNPDAPPVTFDS